MEVRVNSNDPDILSDLNSIINLKYATVSFTVTRRECTAAFWGTGYSSPVMAMPTYEDVDLRLSVMISQKSILVKEDVFQHLESRIGGMCHHVGGMFLGRSVQPFDGKDVYLVEYSIKLTDYDNFTTKLHQMALTQLDREFIEVLEQEIAE